MEASHFKDASKFLLLRTQLGLGFLQGLGQLVRAGGGLHAAADALHTGDHILDFLALYQRSDSLQVAVAAAQELYVMDLSVLHIKIDELRTGPLGLVSKVHDKFFLS